jgi:hypothetical protein
VKASERPRRRAGRPKPIHRPVLQFRVHPDVYADLKKKAAELKLTIAQEAARRLDRYAEYIQSFGNIKRGRGLGALKRGRGLAANQSS